MGSERVNPEVMEDQGVREESEQVYIRRQRPDRQQCVPPEVTNEEVPQDERVGESDADRTDLDAGVGFIRDRRDRLPCDGGLHPGDLQHQKCENDQSQYAGEQPQDDPDDTAGNRWCLLLAHKSSLTRAESRVATMAATTNGRMICSPMSSMNITAHAPSKRSDTCA